MATSKTLTPTNVTIQIPEFTDQPDQRVNSNCIDKEADAINALNSQITTINGKIGNLSAKYVEAGSYTWDSLDAIQIAFGNVSDQSTGMIMLSCKNGLRCLYIVARDESTYGDVFLLPCGTGTPKIAKNSNGTWTINTLTLS